MADNVEVTPSASYTVAAEDIGGGIEVQRVKVVLGTVGEDGGDVGLTNPMPVTGSVGVSGAVSISAMPAVSGTVTVNGSVAVVPGVSVVAQVSGAVSISAMPAVSGTVTVNGSVAVVPGVSVVAQVSGTVTVANGPSVTIQQGASVSMPALAGVVASSVPATSVALGVPVWIVGGQTATGVPVLVSGAVSVSALPVVSMTGALVSVVSTILGTQIVTLATGATIAQLLGSVQVSGVVSVTGVSLNVVVSGPVSISAMPAVSISAVVPVTTQASVSVTGLPVWMNPTQGVTILGTQLVTNASIFNGTAGVPALNATGVVVWNAGVLLTVGLPTQASTAQIVVVKPAPLQYVQIAVTSTAIAVSANKYLFTIWTGATGAPAAAGTTSWAVPAGKVLSLQALQAAITSSAVLGGSVQLFVGVGATASMISASIQTQLQVLRLQLFGGANLESAALVGHQADIAAGESIAVFVVASTAAILRDLVIAGNLY